MKMRYQMKKGRNQKGFTLVELMVVVVIIGILSAIAVPVYNNVTEKAEASACKANIRTLEGALEAYKAVNNITGQVSGGADAIKELLVPDYIKEWPKCPDGTAEYTHDADTDTFSCTIHSEDAEDAEDDDE